MMTGMFFTFFIIGGGIPDQGPETPQKTNDCQVTEIRQYYQGKFTDDEGKLRGFIAIRYYNAKNEVLSDNCYGAPYNIPRPAWFAPRGVTVDAKTYG